MKPAELRWARSPGPDEDIASPPQHPIPERGLWMGLTLGARGQAAPAGATVRAAQSWCSRAASLPRLWSQPLRAGPQHGSGELPPALAELRELPRRDAGRGAPPGRCRSVTPACVRPQSRPQWQAGMGDRGTESLIFGPILTGVEPQAPSGLT